MSRPSDAAQPTMGISPLVATTVAPSGGLGLLLRALIAVGLIAGWAQLAHTPIQRPVEELVRGLETGRVTSVTIERPPPNSSGQFPVEWDGPRRPSYSSYHHDDLDGSAAPDAVTPRIDRAEIIALAERAGVPVVERDWEPASGGIRWELAGMAWLAGLFLLVGGAQPRLATRWAWFWLAFHAPPAMLLFVLLEPAPWGRRSPIAPASRKLTGGWALLLSFLLVALLHAVPWYSELFPR